MTSSDEEEERSVAREKAVLDEADEVYKMIARLEKMKEAKGTHAMLQEIDGFIRERDDKRKEDKGCSTKYSRTSINKRKSEEEERERETERRAERLKLEGNDCFTKGDYKRSVELYTSSILERGDNPLVFTNRAQARIHLGLYDEAVEDCRQAIKLKPDLVKAQIHLARALKGKGDFQQAIEVLEVAGETSKGYEEVLRRYREDVVQQMKHTMLGKVGPVLKE